jgi:hypothetical protein
MEPSNHHLHSHDNNPSPFLGSVKHGVSVHTDHGEQAEEVGFGQPNSVGHDKHAGHSVVMFRDRFWVCLALTVPALIWEPMLQARFSYRAGVSGVWALPRRLRHRRLLLWWVGVFAGRDARTGRSPAGDDDADRARDQCRLCIQRGDHD